MQIQNDEEMTKWILHSTCAVILLSINCVFPNCIYQEMNDAFVVSQ